MERRWNEALIKVAKIKKEFAEHQHKERLTATSEQKARIKSLSQDLPRLWKAHTTQAKDRKRILRLLIKDITIEKLPEPKRLVLHLRWQGGACEDIPIIVPPKMGDQIRYPRKLVDKVRELAKERSDDGIATALNQQGLLSAKGKAFTV